jgi:hypothetical protein
MVLHGRVQNGVVVLDDGSVLPEGTLVSVVAESAVPDGPPQAERMSDEERRRVKQILDRITAMPDENPGDSFRGAEHDQVLYGKP